MYHKRFQWLLGIFLLIFMLGWKALFGKSLYAFLEHKSLKAKASQIDNINQQIGYYGDLIRGFGADTYDGETFFDHVTRFCAQENLAIKKFPQADLFENGGIKVNIHSVEVAGALNAILKLIYFIENNKKYGKVVSCQLYKEERQTTNLHQLVGKIVIQNNIKQKGL